MSPGGPTLCSLLGSWNLDNMQNRIYGLYFETWKPTCIKYMHLATKRENLQHAFVKVDVRNTCALFFARFFFMFKDSASVA